MARDLTDWLAPLGDLANEITEFIVNATASNAGFGLVMWIIFVLIIVSAVVIGLKVSRNILKKP